MLKTYLEIISQEKYKEFEEKNKHYLTSEKYKKRFEELLKRFFTDENGKIINTIIIPYFSQNTQSLKQIDKEIITYLNNHGYRCTEESYLLGYCFNDKNKKMPIVDVLKMISQYNLEKLEKQKQENLQYSANYDNKIKAKQNFKENYLTYYQNFTKNRSKVIVFTWLPRAIASMSTNVGWTSCMNLYKGGSTRYIFPSIEAGIFIAWLVQEGDEEILDNPQARILIKTYVSQNDKVFWYPSGDIFGTASKDFYEKVKDFVLKKQEIHITDKDLEYIYIFDNAQYVDDSTANNYLSLKIIFKERYIKVLNNKIKNNTQFTITDLEDAIKFNIDINLVKKVLLYIKNNINKDDFHEILKIAYQYNRYDVINMILTDTSYHTLIDKEVFLQYAVKINNIEIVKKLLHGEIDANFDYNNIIEIAIEKNFVDIVKLLLQNKIIQSKINKQHIFNSAIKYICYDIVKLLLQDKTIDPSENNNYAVKLAARQGSAEIVKLLSQDPRVDPSAPGIPDKFSRSCATPENNSAIELAAIFGRAEVMKVLLKDPRIDPSFNHNTVIRAAAAFGHTEVVKVLLQDPRVDPSDMNNEALQKAIGSARVEVVQALLQDPRVDPSDNNNIALEYAIKHEHIQIVQALLQHKKLKLTQHNSNFISLAISTHNMKMIKLLLQDNRLDPCYNNNEALETAILINNPDIVQLLLQDKRVRSNLTKDKLNDYIHLATQNKCTQVINLLQQYKKHYQ